MNELFIPLVIALSHTNWLETIQSLFPDKEIIEVDGYYNPVLVGFQITKLVIK